MGNPMCNGVQMCREGKDVYLKTATYTLVSGLGGGVVTYAFL